MKQKDIAVIIVVAIFSAVVSLLLSTKLLISPTNRQQKAEEVDKISTTFNLPDERFFNEASINPTQQGQLGDKTNPNPFNGVNR
ncbi:hypothetical protein IPP75_03605 [Candidatus Saccharibacteria bacterium]|jgi:hypothetical protein|nr:MAG: hypothetical protein IPP75_03605 [Candidatus Saccharibacteria bacterium]